MSMDLQLQHTENDRKRMSRHDANQKRKMDREKETREWSQTLCWIILILESTLHRFVLFKILVLMPPAATNRAALII